MQLTGRWNPRTKFLFQNAEQWHYYYYQEEHCMGPVGAVTPSNQRELALNSCEVSVPSPDGGQIHCGIIMDSYTLYGSATPWDNTVGDWLHQSWIRAPLTSLKYTQVYTALSQSVCAGVCQSFLSLQEYDCHFSLCKWSYSKVTSSLSPQDDVVHGSWFECTIIPPTHPHPASVSPVSLHFCA